MKITKLLSGVALAALFAGTAHAAAGAMSFGVTAGAGMPFGDFSDYASTGFNFGVTGDRMMNDSWALGGEISWHTFGGNDDLEKQLSVQYGQTVDYTTRLMPITAHAKYMIPASETAHPFLKVALGVYNMKLETDGGTLNVDESETKFGFQIGGGLTISRGEKMAYGADVLYHYIATEDDASNMLTLRGHLMFGFPGN